MRITTTRLHLVLAVCCALTGTADGLWIGFGVVVLTLLRQWARHSLEHAVAPPAAGPYAGVSAQLRA